MNDQIFFWIMSIVGVLGTGLLTIIGFLLWADRKAIHNKEEKQDRWILSIQKEVSENSAQILLLNQAVRVNQQQDSRRMDIIEKSLDGNKIAEAIYVKLKAMGS